MSIGTLGEQALGSYALYAEYVAQTVQAQPTGTVAQIPNELKSVYSSIATLIDPVRIEAIKAHVANQMNEQSGGPTFVDLSDRICDIQLDTVAQGAGTLKITIADPNCWLIGHEDPSGNTFIQADATGYLWPPIDINYPQKTDCWWRLCQVNASTFTGDPNIILTFEDRSVSWLREMNSTLGGVAQVAPEATIGGFVSQLVNGANQYLRGHAATSGMDWEPIRLVELISSKDVNATPPSQTPASANPNAAISRQNPDKSKQGWTKAQKQYAQRVLNTPEHATHTTLADLDYAMAQQQAAFNGGTP